MNESKNTRDMNVRDRFGRTRSAEVIGCCSRDGATITDRDLSLGGLCQECYSEDELCYRAELTELERTLGLR